MVRQLHLLQLQCKQTHLNSFFIQWSGIAGGERTGSALLWESWLSTLRMHSRYSCPCKETSFDVVSETAHCSRKPASRRAFSQRQALRLMPPVIKTTRCSFLQLFLTSQHSRPQLGYEVSFSHILYRFFHTHGGSTTGWVLSWQVNYLLFLEILLLAANDTWF